MLCSSRRNLRYSIFSQLIDFGFLPDLYTRISMYVHSQCKRVHHPLISNRDDEIVTPHQTVLLKLLDSYLHTSSLTTEMCQQLSPTIASTFFDLAEYVDHALARALPPEEYPSSAPSLLSASSTPGTTASPPSTPVTPLDNQNPSEIYAATAASGPGSGRLLSQPASTRELDMILPQVCEALVLITQCLITLALTSEDPELNFPPGDNPKDFFNSAMVEDGHGFVETLISELYLLHTMETNCTHVSIRPFTTT
jgi:ataxin-10